MISEQTFRAYRSSPHQLRKIQSKEPVKSLLGNVEVISYFNSITDCDICSVSVISEEIKMNMLEQIFKLCIRVRSFSYANDITSKQKLHTNFP